MKGREAVVLLLSFCQLSHCPECVICEFPLAWLLHCLYISEQCFRSVGPWGGGMDSGVEGWMRGWMDDGVDDGMDDGMDGQRDGQ